MVETLVLTASEVARCLPHAECRLAIERAFALLARGKVEAPRSIGFESRGGSFHCKAALFDAERPRFVAKLNGNFPGNPAARALPTIQGVLMLADAADGRPLALMDSGTLTAIRTAAASAVAAAHLARRNATIVAIVGCGLQGETHADALLALGPFSEFRLFDLDATRAERLAGRLGTLAGIRAVVGRSVAEITLGADVIATCTTGASFTLGEDDVAPGAFVAGVGADNPHKREIHPALLKRARVVVDDLAQCAKGGDLHHAIDAGQLREEDVHADLGAVIAGQRPGRTGDDEIFVFDSTGIALEDAAAADIAYERARALGLGTVVRFGA